jgi:flap endonuclease-1
MGITGFKKFYQPCMEERNFNDYRGNKVVVDVMFQIYKYAIAIRNKGKDMLNEKGESMSHLYAIFSYTMFLVKHGIQPIYLFDNKAPDIKRDTLDERRKQKDRSTEVCKNLDDKMSDEYIKHFKRSYVLTEKNIQECQQLLQAMGIPFQQCIGEADPQCAALSCDKSILGVIGEDTDITVFGTKLLLKDFTGKKKKVKELSMCNILNFLQEKTNLIRLTAKLTPMIVVYEHFVDFSIMMGCDYNHDVRIKGYDNEKLFNFFALSELNVPKTIEMIIQDIKIKRISEPNIHCDVPDNYLRKWQETRDHYMDVDIIHPDVIDKDMKPPNKEEILRIMCYENDFEINSVNDMIDELQNMYRALKGVLNDNNSNFNNFKSYQLKYQYMKLNKTNSKDRHYKLLVKQKASDNKIYHIDKNVFDEDNYNEYYENDYNDHNTVKSLLPYSLAVM